MLLLPVGLQKKGFTPLRPIKKNNVKSALKLKLHNLQHNRAFLPHNFP